LALVTNTGSHRNRVTCTTPYNSGAAILRARPRGNGRAGWNIVTTAGVDGRVILASTNSRCTPSVTRGRRFIDVTLKLWMLRGLTSYCRQGAGVWGDKHEIHRRTIEQVFLGGGSAEQSRSPQAYPLLVSSRLSDDGKDLAARYAEAVFTPSRRSARAGVLQRPKVANPSSRTRPQYIKILPGIVPVLAALSTKRRKGSRIESHMCTNTLSAAVGLLRSRRTTHLDSQLRTISGRERDRGLQEPYSLIVEDGRREKLTIARIIGRWAAAGAFHVHRQPRTGGQHDRKSGLRTGPPTDSISCRHSGSGPTGSSRALAIRSDPAIGTDPTPIRAHYGLSSFRLNQHSRDSAKMSRYELLVRTRTPQRPVPAVRRTRFNEAPMVYDKPPRTSIVARVCISVCCCSHMCGGVE